MKLKDLVVSPYNARDPEDQDEGIDDLKASIKAHTLISKLILRPGKGGKFEIVAGQRRYKALVALLGEEHELPESDYVLIADLKDQEAYVLSLTENQQRLDLSPLALNKASLKLNSWGFDSKKIAKILNMTPHRVKRIMELSQNISRLPDEAKQELRKPLEESKFHDGHVDKIKDLEDRDLIKDVVDYIIDKESPPREVPSIVKAIKKQYEGKGGGSDESESDKKGKEPENEGPLEYIHKGEMKLEIHDDKKILKVVGKGAENENDIVPIDHYLEYLMHPEKFRCFVSFKLKIKPIE